MNARPRRRCRCLNGRLCVCDVIAPMPVGAAEILLATLAVIGWVVFTALGMVDK